MIAMECTNLAGQAEQLVAFIAPFGKLHRRLLRRRRQRRRRQGGDLALGDRALAITGVSASLAAGELEAAQRLAAAIGIRHETLDTDELSQA